jgi:hypothetical protein
VSLWLVSRWVLLFVAPYAVFTAAGVLLWKRSHTVATGMVALGFAAALLGQVAALLEGLEAGESMHAHSNGSSFVFSWLTHYVGIAFGPPL